MEKQKLWSELTVLLAQQPASLFHFDFVLLVNRFESLSIRSHLGATFTISDEKCVLSSSSSFSAAAAPSYQDSSSLNPTTTATSTLSFFHYSSPCESDSLCQVDSDDPAATSCVCRRGFTGQLCQQSGESHKNKTRAIWPVLHTLFFHLLLIFPSCYHHFQIDFPRALVQNSKIRRTQFAESSNGKLVCFSYFFEDFHMNPFVWVFWVVEGSNSL